MRDIGGVLAVPLRFLGRVLRTALRSVAGGVGAGGRRLARPVGRVARVAQRGLRRCVEPWQRVRRRWDGIRERLAATRGRIVARLSRRAPGHDDNRV